MKKLFTSALTLAFLAVCSIPSVMAQSSLPPYQVVADGTQYQIELDASQRSLKEISVYYTSTGNITTTTEVQIEGPMGIKASVVGGFIGAQDAASVLSTGKGLAPIRTRVSFKKDAQDFGLTPSSSDPRAGSAYVWHHLQKDNCGGARSDKYVAQLQIDLSGVDPALFDLTFKIRLSIKELKFTRSMVASIKPASDGKYRGEPILLMSSVGYPEYVNIVSWRNKRITRTRRIPVVKYVSYKGYGLSLARLNGVLNGGKATFELTNGGEIYGVCFTAVRKRQSVNGYPAPN